MGEIAEAVLGGLFCQVCGEIMPDMAEPGYPRTCPGCGGDGQGRVGRQKRRRARVAAQKAERRDAAEGWLQQNGFRQMGNPWHFQLRLPGCPALDYWPSRSKWCVRSVVYLGDRAKLEAFIAQMKKHSEGQKP